VEKLAVDGQLGDEDPRPQPHPPQVKRGDASAAGAELAEIERITQSTDFKPFESWNIPAKNVTVLATATAPTSMPNGTGENEPILMAIAYGKGRVFHDTLGHVGATQKEPIPGMNSVDYIVLLQRGTEWAATGSVTIPVPKDFPTADKTSSR